MNAIVRPRAAATPAADGRSLAAVGGQLDHLVGPARQRRVGGAVARAVVDDHDLQPAVGGDRLEGGADRGDRGADAGRLVEGGHDHGRRAGRRARAAARLARGGSAARPRGARPGTAPGARRPRRRAPRALAPTSAGVDVKPWAANTPRRTTTSTSGGDRRHHHEGARHPHPAHERIGAERHAAVQAVGHDRRDRDRRQVGQDEDPAQALAQQHEQPDVDGGRHEGHHRQASQPPAQGSRCRASAARRAPAVRPAGARRRSRARPAPAGRAPAGGGRGGRPARRRGR